MNEENKGTQLTTTHSYGNDYDTMTLRLNPDPLIEAWEYNIRGISVVFMEREDGTMVAVPQEYGKPLANKEGIQAIMGWIRSQFNPQTVQGNFPSNGAGYSESYERFIRDLRLGLNNDFMINLDNYGIDENKYDYLIDQFISTAKTYFSRLIDNQERISYGRTVQQQDTRMERSKSGFSLFRSG